MQYRKTFSKIALAFWQVQIITTLWNATIYDTSNPCEHTSLHSFILFQVGLSSAIPMLCSCDLQTESWAW